MNVNVSRRVMLRCCELKQYIFFLILSNTKLSRREHEKCDSFIKWMIFRKRWKANFKNQAELHLISMIGIKYGIEAFADIT